MKRGNDSLAMVRSAAGYRLATLLLLVLLGNEVAALEIDEFAPDFRLPRLDSPDQQVELESSRGKVLFLDFWASECESCRASLHAVDLLRSELASEQFEVISINVDMQPEDALRSLTDFPLGYPVLSDSARRAFDAYELSEVPASFVINPLGDVTWRRLGPKPVELVELRRHIEDLLSVSWPAGNLHSCEVADPL